MSLPQDSVLRAHLRRQADWPEDGPRLCRRPDDNAQRKKLLADIDRIGSANRVAAQAASPASDEAGPEPLKRSRS